MPAAAWQHNKSLRASQEAYTIGSLTCSANTDDMYARFLAGPEVISRARRSDSATTNGNDVLAAKQAEAAAMAEANPYAAFSGISEAGLQSSVFQAPVWHTPKADLHARPTAAA